MKYKLILHSVDGAPTFLPTGHEILWVADKFRTNELSHQPGGTWVMTLDDEDQALGYDKIKFPSRYIRVFAAMYFKMRYDDVKAMGEDELNNEFKEHGLRAIWAVTSDGVGKKVWDQDSDESPAEVLKAFDNIKGKIDFQGFEAEEEDDHEGEEFETDFPF